MHDRTGVTNAQVPVTATTVGGLHRLPRVGAGRSSGPGKRFKLLVATTCQLRVWKTLSTFCRLLVTNNKRCIPLALRARTLGRPRRAVSPLGTLKS